MNHSKVIVQRRDGSKARGVRVVLSFSSGLSEAVHTDADGIALIDHATVGRADVLVDGSRRGSLHAPGQTVVFI